MKKAMMVLVTAAMAATVMADVPSKNVVGFTTTEAQATKSVMQAMQFQKVGGGTNTLEELPINPATSDGTIIQIAYLDGIKIKFNGYTCYSEDPNYLGGPAGWYDAGNAYVGDTVKISAGSAFWLIPSMTADLEFAGEVVTNDLQVSVEATKSQMICNPYPVSVDLEDLPINPATSDGTIIQVPYLDGIKIKFNGYTCYSEDPNYLGGPAGWYDAGNTYVGSSVQVPVGQGFWLIPSFTGSITFTSPL